MSLYVFMLGGLAVAAIFNFNGVQNSQWYLLTVATLLGAGLYSSTFGISIKEARQHTSLIFKAITIGVLLKALLIGAAMTLILRNSFGFILGIIVAQIDPLSTTALMKGNRMSKRAKTILAAWSSFDDPMTVIMSLYAPIVIAMTTGTSWQPIHGSMQAAGLGGYFAETGINLLFAGGIFVLWQLMRRHSRATNYFVVGLIALAMYGLLIGSLSIAVYYFWMLGVAVLGLFMRPPIDAALSHIVQWALNIAAILLGILLINGANLWPGIALGFFAYSAQIVVGLLLTRTLPRKDQLHIAFSQQNGITAIILALLFETYYPGTIAIVAPAIVTINIVHALANKALDIKLEQDYRQLSVRYHLERLRAHIAKV
jgi:NhaP-type Na+/H+ and K+/H+ antiporter